MENIWVFLDLKMKRKERKKKESIWSSRRVRELDLDGLDEEWTEKGGLRALHNVPLNI